MPVKDQNEDQVQSFLARLAGAVWPAEALDTVLGNEVQDAVTVESIVQCLTDGVNSGFDAHGICRSRLDAAVEYWMQRELRKFSDLPTLSASKLTKDASPLVGAFLLMKELHLPGSGAYILGLFARYRGELPPLFRHLTDADTWPWSPRYFYDVVRKYQRNDRTTLVWLRLCRMQASDKLSGIYVHEGIEGLRSLERPHLASIGIMHWIMSRPVDFFSWKADDIVTGMFIRYVRSNAGKSLPNAEQFAEHLVQTERRRQKILGRTIEWDAKYPHGELTSAAMGYYRAAKLRSSIFTYIRGIFGYNRAYAIPDNWPSGRGIDWRPKDTIRDLTRAGALLLAEGDRLGLENTQRLPAYVMPAIDNQMKLEEVLTSLTIELKRIGV